MHRAEDAVLKQKDNNMLRKLSMTRFILGVMKDEIYK